MRLPAAAAVLLPLAALAAPVAWSGPSARGDLAPVEPTAVRLLSERLQVRLEEDGRHYRVLAEYLLANPGPPVELPLTVPLRWFPDISGDGLWDRVDSPAAAGYAGDLQIGVPGRYVSCALGEPRRVRSRPVPPWERPEDFPRVEARCLTRLLVPTGEAIPVTLGYAGELEFVDLRVPGSPFTAFDVRLLRHALSSAGGWAGGPGRLEVELAPGPWEGLVVPVSPASGWRTEPGRLSLRAEGAALAGLAAVEVRVEVGRVLAARERVARRGPEAGRLEARASSAMPPRSGAHYDAESALDGDGETAWCAWRRREGSDPWIEVRAADLGAFLRGSCRLVGYVFTPGYVRSQGSFTRNERATAVRLAPCDRPDQGPVLRLPLAERHDVASAVLEAGTGDPFREALEALGAWRAGHPAGAGDDGRPPFPACARLTLLAGERGPEGLPCLSEFRPLFDCRR
jgi:hypothetical protein